MNFLKVIICSGDAGFNNINIDLMSDIPKQSFESYKKTLERVVSLKPEHISSYSLILEPGTVFYKMHEDGVLDIADEDTDRQMYSYTKKSLKKMVITDMKYQTIVKKTENVSIISSTGLLRIISG